MAGLPRSGSTLLSSILSQNPNIHAGPSSPIAACMYSVDHLLQKDELYKAYPKPEQAKLMISNLMSQYYSDIDKPVVIDKNRAWPAHVPLIENNLQQKAKIICPVRDIDEILASMIAMLRRNSMRANSVRSNFIDEPLIKQNIPINDENRCHYIAGPNGILGNSLRSIVDGARAGFLDRLLFVEYKALMAEPEQTIQSIYEFLGEPSFKHDFNNIENTNQERDLDIYGLEDMHTVRKAVKATAPNPKDVLPAIVIQRCQGMDIWRRPEELLK
ncbi:MAG: sulfotransferase [Arenimonas sp.]|nr:sulfotransferase [Arenimonas sp.]